MVTCLCLTKNRREWLPKAIAGFLDQTYQNRELLVVADGESVSDLIPPDARIRLIEVPSMSIGQKRNIGAAKAHGKIIVTWDDDDSSAPDRIDFQVNSLLKTRKSVTGLSKMFFVSVPGGERFVLTARPNCVVGTSLVFTRTWWARHPFPPVQVAEDAAFAGEAWACGELDIQEGLGLMEASIHAGNTSPRDLTASNFSRIG